jgi:hypothetical protein
MRGDSRKDDTSPVPRAAARSRWQLASRGSIWLAQPGEFIFCEHHDERHRRGRHSNTKINMETTQNSNTERGDVRSIDCSAFPRVWIFDTNRRVYERDENGRAKGGPIWRDHWKEIPIVGETRVSWVSRYGDKIPKKGGYGIAFSEEEIDRAAFVQEHRSKIVRVLERCQDYDTLIKVAGVLGYMPNAQADL